ncbi:MAG: multidrug ABC transporter substrate-binding protein [Acidobacteria bacterium]|nr:MAG: multidrug ABC transporter substrate-binding protein [Acidobacteriota bacterium]
MDFLATLRVALSSLERHKMRSCLTMLGVVIGIAAVVASVSFGEGANNVVQAQIANMGTNLLYVFAGSISRRGVHQGWGSISTLTVEDAQTIARDCSAVKLVSAGVGGKVQVVYGNQNWFTDLNGVDVTFPIIRNWPMASGAFFSEEDVHRAANVVAVGQTVVDVLFGEEEPLGQTIRIKNIPFRVIGVLAPKGQAAFGFDQDDRVEIPYTTAQKKIVGNTYLQFIAMSAVDRDAVILAQDLASVASISLLVGGIGIMNIMLVSVTERTREIGIRMATGATEADIRLQFIVEAVALSLVGGILGIIVGVFLSGSVARLFGWPRFISFTALTAAVVFSTGVGIFFGYYPAGKAAKLDPIEALRYE